MSEVILYDSTADGPISNGASGNSSPIPSIPTRDLDVLDLCKDITPHWEASGLTLLRTPINMFKDMVSTYEIALMSSSVHKAELSPAAGQIETFDKTINKNLGYIKDYLKEQYDRKTAAQYYRIFGFVYEYGAYKFPSKQNERLKSLSMLLSAIQKYGLSNRPYGLDYWQPIYNQYSNFLGQTKSITGNKTTTVKEKNALKEKLQYKLRMIIKMIECNYEEDAPAVMRMWGFQKERYR